jgi:hypothetical protein
MSANYRRKQIASKGKAMPSLPTRTDGSRPRLAVEVAGDGKVVMRELSSMSANEKAVWKEAIAQAWIDCEASGPWVAASHAMKQLREAGFLVVISDGAIAALKAAS